MDQHIQRIDSIEERTRKVEEAVIKFGYIAETVLVQMENRIKSVENKCETLETAIYQTCDAKTDEIALAKKDVLIIGGTAIGSMFTMFIGALVYLNASDMKIYDTLALHHEEVIKSIDQISYVKTSVDTLEHKIDNLTKTIKDK